MEYNFRDIEKKWQQRWNKDKIYRVAEQADKKKFYVLNMFPYPSGAGLHVGHPLGYIASDIYARYKHMCGYNVLNPMGYDAYGLPAEQYAIQTGQHPALTTEENIARYRSQLDRIGFSFDWSREVRTCDPKYYRWTQWAFQKMFNSFYDYRQQKARPIAELIRHFEEEGTLNMNVAQSEEKIFSARDWLSMNDDEQQRVLMNYRIAYLGETMVNWCAELGTVLANDEVVNGVSERGGFPVVQMKMKQWCLRVSAYAERLLNGLETVNWTDSLKETQRNWIGRSEGAEVNFKTITPTADGEQKGHMTVFTTRADTMFGVTFIVLAPESELIDKLTTIEQQNAVKEYLAYVEKRTELERMSDRKVTGVFTGSFAVNPFTGEQIPIWISEYVLAGYGTGAIMAVPGHDSRDHAFARHFNLPIVPLIEGADVTEESFDAKEGIMMNSPRNPKEGDFTLNGLTVKEAISRTKEYLEQTGIGRIKTNYRLRDATFSRQRYWGEPFPVYYKNNLPYMIPEKCLPLELPEIDKYEPTESGEPPLGRAAKWAWNETEQKVVDKSLIDGTNIFPLELCTMPGFAGSSAYYLRYMDPHNDKELVSKEADEYWQNVDLYVGGTEHATGHLIYSRFWNKFLFDYGYSCKEEPYDKLINQGMIQGRSSFVYRLANTKNIDRRIKRKFYKAFNGINSCFVDHKNKYIYASRKIRRPINKGVPEGYTVIHLRKKAISFSTEYPTFICERLLNSLIANSKKTISYTPIHVDVNFVKNDVLNLDAFKKWRPEYSNAEFILENGKYICGWAVEKMSKSMFNVVNPDDIIEQYGADTLRLYEMFLGPVEASKPWDTNGIDGCFRFLKKFWKLCQQPLTNDAPSADMLKSINKLTKKITADIEQFSYNTAVSAFMICVNELSAQSCTNRDILRQLVVLIAPFTPHIAEELWVQLGSETTVYNAPWPEYNEAYLVENEMNLTVSFNGKARYQITLPTDAGKEAIEKAAINDERSGRYLEGKSIVKVIIVPGKIINIVLK